MLKRAIDKLAKRSFKANRYDKRVVVAEQALNDHRSTLYNPRSARHKSLKGLFPK